MKASEYRREREKLGADKSRLAQELAEVAAKIDALDLVWTTIFNAKPPESAPTDLPDLADSSVNNLSVASLVIDVVGSLEGSFGVSEVESAIKERLPGVEVNRSTITGRLNKLVDAGQLTLIQRGAGRRASTFQRKAS